MCPWPSTSFHGPSGRFLDLLSPTSLPPVQKRDAQHMFLQHKGGGGKKTNKQKTHKHFSDGPCGTIVPGTNRHPSQGQTGQNGDFTVELNRETAGLSQGQVPHFVPGKGPICPRDRFLFVPGHRPAENVYVYWFFLCPKVGHEPREKVRCKGCLADSQHRTRGCTA